MTAARYLKATGIFILGAIVIVYGLYTFFTESSTETMNNSFYIMVIGLLVSGIGSRYGHKKLRSPEFRKAVDEERKEKDLRKREKEMERKKQAKEKKREEEANKKELSKQADRIEEKKDAKPVPSEKEEQVKGAAPDEPPKGGVIKILICPFCGEENKYTAIFCDRCGKRLRPK